ncbi:Gfo/Idh/MocA family oxidoreductase [Crossiella sp. SN42]|uniref:Gfo/Idh/MocA family protein n=1 Tax=Crossiella sp. SN42 TaxID=2944808 RepID=UPI00207C2C20|nr:Gfo/Idh/MocA family oxidoreductase [Crossiella sp. SN42]MCO1580673.1 Gfo/Idh/MocA family oxidoreductase [Crossiella sp. SN42]
MPDKPPLRIGVLGAARIAPAALLTPARATPTAEVVAIAARDVERARRFARKHDIARVHPDYASLLADPDLDAVYLPLPNSLHGRWTLAALAAGKHVLCEKPFTANAAEARQVAAAALGSGLVVMEAFHYRYHPLFRRAVEIIAAGELGTVERIETALCFPLPKFSDIRYRFELAGGAQMDAGCYAVHMARTLGLAAAEGEPEVLSARARLRGEDVDRAMRAELRFPAGHTARTRCSMWSRDLLRISASVRGDRGELRILNPVAPQFGHRLTVRAGGHRRVERFDKRSSYAHQLDAFVAAVRDGGPVLTPPADSVATMAVIDAIYTAAGLPARVADAT